MMKSFRMMSLPLLVGTFFLFCGAPKAGATTGVISQTTNSLHIDGHWIADAEFVNLKSLLAEDAKWQTFFYHRTGALKPHKIQFLSVRGRGERIWILTFIELPADRVTGVSNVSMSLPLTASLAPATTVAAASTSVPEAPSILYLGSGLLLCGGFWLRRRRFRYRTECRSLAE